MFNKAKYTLDKSKKILHKIKKQWVAISVVMLGLIGGAAAATTPIHVNANSINNHHSTITEEASQLHSNLVNNATQNRRPAIQLGAESNDGDSVNSSDQTNNYTNSDSWSDFNNTDSYSDNINNSNLNDYSMSDDNLSNSANSDDISTNFSSLDNSTSYSDNSWSDINNDNYPSDNNSWNSLSDSYSNITSDSDMANYPVSDENNQISESTNVIPSDYSYNSLSDYNNSDSNSDFNNSFSDSTFPGFGYDSDLRWKSDVDPYSYSDYSQSNSASNDSNGIIDSDNIWSDSFESNSYSDYSLSSSDSSQAGLSSNSYDFGSSVSTKSSGSRSASTYKGAIKVDGITCIPSTDSSYDTGNVISQITINGVNYVQISDDYDGQCFDNYESYSDNYGFPDGIEVLPSASDNAIEINNTTYLALANIQALNKDVKHTNSDVNIDGTDFIPAKYVSAKSIISNYHERNVKMDQATYNFYKPYFDTLNPVPTLSDVNNVIESNSGSVSDFTESNNTSSVTLLNFPRSDMDKNPEPFVSQGITYVPVDNYGNYSDNQYGGGVSYHVNSSIRLLIKSGINYVPVKYTEYDSNGYYSIDNQYITMGSYMDGIPSDGPYSNQSDNSYNSPSDESYDNPSDSSDNEIGGKDGTYVNSYSSFDPNSIDSYNNNESDNTINSYNPYDNPSDATGYSDETNYDID